jgi:hypothetical protein
MIDAKDGSAPLVEERPSTMCSYVRATRKSVLTILLQHFTLKEFSTGRKRLLPRRLRWTFDPHGRGQKNSDRSSFLGDRLRQRAPARSVHEHPEIRALDRQSNGLRIERASVIKNSKLFVMGVKSD